MNPDLSPTTDSKPRRRGISRRPTILALMIFVAFSGLVFAAVRFKIDTHRRVHLAKLKTDLARAEDRMAWSIELSRSSYVKVPKAVVLKDQNEVARIQDEIGHLEGP